LSAPALTLFDLDGTLLPRDSDHAFGEFLVDCGWADAQTHRRRNQAFYEDYLAQRLDMHAYVDFATSAWRDRTAHELAAVRQRFLRDVVEPMMHPSAVELVASHRARGDVLAMVTATNEFVTRPIADAFGFETLLATELQRDETGRVTGSIHGTPCYREGKIARVSQWLASRGARWDDFLSITVYSDSMNDLPLLERASEAVATNPSADLAAVARERGWRILKLFA
jgi:HAD superfamily hydrolase (TIGR01490 family)